MDLKLFPGERRNSPSSDVKDIKPWICKYVYNSTTYNPLCWQRTNIYRCQSSFHSNNFNNEFNIEIFHLLKNFYLCWILIEMLGTEVWVTDCGSHDGASSLLCLQNGLHHHSCIVSLPSQVLAIQRFVGTLKININKVYFSYF